MSSTFGCDLTDTSRSGLACQIILRKEVFYLLGFDGGFRHVSAALEVFLSLLLMFLRVTVARPPSFVKLQSEFPLLSFYGGIIRLQTQFRVYGRMLRWHASNKIRCAAPCSIIQATGHHPAQYLFVLAQIVAGGGLDILMTGQVFDMGDVSPVVAENCTEGMTQDMRGQLLGDSSLGFEVYKKAGDIFAPEDPDRIASGYKQGRILINAAIQVLANPKAAALGEEHCAPAFALAHDVGIRAAGCIRFRLQGQSFGNAHTGGQQQFRQRPQPQTRNSPNFNSIQVPLNFWIGQVDDLRSRPLGE